MGCSASKETHVPASEKPQVYDAHVRRRFSLAVDCDDPPAEPRPLLKLAQRGFVVADDAAPRTPAITPQAEAGRCTKARRTSDAREAHRPVDNSSSSSSSSDDEHPGRCAQQGLPERRVSAKASCDDVDEGGQDESCSRTGGGESEQLEGCRRYGVVDAGDDTAAVEYVQVCERRTAAADSSVGSESGQNG